MTTLIINSKCLLSYPGILLPFQDNQEKSANHTPALKSLPCATIWALSTIHIHIQCQSSDNVSSIFRTTSKIHILCIFAEIFPTFWTASLVGTAIPWMLLYKFRQPYNSYWLQSRPVCHIPYCYVLAIKYYLNGNWLVNAHPYLIHT